MLADLGNHESGKKIIEASMQRKGILLKINSQIQQISRFSRDPSFRTFKKTRARKKLAALTLSGPTTDTKEQHPRILFELEKVDAMEAELGKHSQKFRASIKKYSVERLERELRDNSALVDMFVCEKEGKRRLIAGVMIKSKTGDVDYRIVEFGDMGKIADSIQEYREIIQDEFADEDELIEIGQSAYDILWAPVADLIGEIDYVYLVPDGLANVVPYNALINPDENYLIERSSCIFYLKL